MGPTSAPVRALRWYINHFPISHGKGPLLRLLQHSLDSGFFPATLDDGMKLLLRADDVVAFLTFVRGVWEPENTTILRHLLQPGDHFLDVGANIGYYTVLAGRLVGPQGVVTAFEPMPATHDWLNRNIALNALTNVTTFAMALGETPGELELHLFAGETVANASQFAAWRTAAVTTTVPCVTLDSLLSRFEDARPLLMKVDVEGGEWSVFHGGQQLLRERRPVLLFELYPALGKEAGWTPADLLDLLRELGRYDFYISSGDGLRPLSTSDIPAVESEGHIDVFAFAADITWHRDRLQQCGLING